MKRAILSRPVMSHGIITRCFALPTLAAVSALFIASQVRASSITWNVAGGGNWNTVTANWTGDATTFTDDGTVDVTFNKTNGGTIVIDANMSPQSTTVSATSGTYVFSGGPIDSGSMIKSGAGTLQLPSSSSFAGGFTLNAGTIECANVANVLGTGTITVNGGNWTGIGNAQGNHTNAVVINGGFWKGHNAGLTLSGPITLNCSPAITNSRNSTSFSGVINDGGNGYGITLHNSRSDAYFSLPGDNTYSGKTIITGNGYVRVLLKNAGAACGFGAPTGPNAVIDLYDNAVIQINSGSVSDRTINIAGDGVGTYGVHLNGNATATIGGITVKGTGAKTLTLVKNGNPGKLTLNGPIPDADDGSKVSIEAPFGSARVDNFLDLKATNTFSGSIKVGTLGWGFLRIGSAGSLGSGSYTNTISIATSCAFDYASSATQELSGVISGGGSVKMSGSGTLTLSSTNTFTGTTTITNGTLVIAAETCLADTNRLTIASSGKLKLNAGIREKVGFLTLGSTAMESGSYGSTASNATNPRDDYFDVGGTGVLYVGIDLPPLAPPGTIMYIR